ncbi:MAG: recombination mediator RecR [Sphingomonadales bacterium]
MQLPSVLLDNAVNAFAALPGIGKKTALRLVLHLLKQPATEVYQFSEVIATLRREIKTCTRCGNIADAEHCTICTNPARKKGMICVVESIRELIAFENTQQYNGLYHVLGGIISPLDGIGPDQLNIHSLIERVRQEGIEELIFALNPTIQGDTTVYYIQKKLKDTSVKISTIARGVAFGGELEYTDEMTLARSLQNRLPLDRYISGL